jgi:hypothetical protein
MHAKATFLIESNCCKRGIVGANEQGAYATSARFSYQRRHHGLAIPMPAQVLGDRNIFDLALVLLPAQQGSAHHYLVQQSPIGRKVFIAHLPTHTSLVLISIQQNGYERLRFVRSYFAQYNVHDNHLSYSGVIQEHVSSNSVSPAIKQ